MTTSLDSLRAYLGSGGQGSRWTPTPGVLVVGSGKGGVGTSTVSALLALVAAQEGRRVLLVDADEGLGSLHFLFGLQDSGPGIGALRGGDLSPADLVRPVTESLWLLPGGGDAVGSTLSTALGERRALLGRVADLFPFYELVIVDGGSHLASVQAACAAGAERLLALTAPDRVSMAATYALLKVTRERFPALPLEVLVNQGDGMGAEEVFQMMATAGRRFLGLKVGFGGSIPRDFALEKGIVAEGSVLDLPPSSPALNALGVIHSRLASEQRGDSAASSRVLAFPASG
jgi:MinD-like ATPase involved in chromosome partitioning or flagellar assembly